MTMVGDTRAAAVEALPEVVVTPGLQPPPAGPPPMSTEPQAAPPQAGGPNEKPWWDNYPDAPQADVPVPPSASSAAKAPPSGGPSETAPANWWDAYPSEPSKTEKKKPQVEVTGPQAALTGVAHGASFGLAPALEGLSESATPSLKKFEEAHGVEPGTVKLPGHIRAAMGLSDKLTKLFTGHEDPEVTAAYERGRKRALEREEAAQEQHPGAFLAGTLAGTVAVPGFGVIRPAATSGRIVQGMVQGGAAGGMFGAGEAVSRGEDLPGVTKSAGRSGVIGAAVGGPLVGAVGPRVVTGAGARAARTAEDLGAPLPRGFASENRAVQSTTARLRQLPIGGTPITERMHAVGEAAGNRVEDIAAGMGGTGERAVTNAIVQPGLQGAIAANQREINAGYNGFRSQINPNTLYTMPTTDRVLTDIMRERAAASHANPAEGLDQFRRAAAGSPFMGAHRARSDARNAGNPTKPHPGYDASDFNRITTAMTADLRQMAQEAAINQTPAGRRAALNAFMDAERQFGPLADLNNLLSKLSTGQGEGAIAKLLSASREKRGDLRLLAQLRASMDPRDFEQIGAQLLSELGGREFSLSKFTTEWGKVSEGAKRVLFTPEHARNLDDIAQLGSHLRGAASESSTSHSANLLVFLEIAQTVMAVGTGAVTGHIPEGLAAAAGAGGASWIMARWLASPAAAASMGAFTRAYRAMTLGQPTPGRVATFRIATRNLANTLGAPLDRVMDIVASKIGVHAEPTDKKDLKKQ